LQGAPKLENTGLGANGSSADRKKALEAALSRFPQFEFTIRRLMDRAQSFRDMCQDLAEAELALARIDEMPPASRDVRKAEWEALVASLVSEVETELGASHPGIESLRLGGRAGGERANNKGRR
jgi:hypothetical protein